MELIQANDNEFPICSFCDKELKQIKLKRIDKGIFKKTKADRKLLFRLNTKSRFRKN